MMSITSLLTNAESRRLLDKFLGIGHRNDKSLVQQRLECYDLCVIILRDRNLIQSDLIDDLVEHSPSYGWEQNITNAIKIHGKNNKNVEIFKLLILLKLKCVSDIERNHDYNRFKLHLFKKYVGRLQLKNKITRKNTNNIKKLLQKNLKITQKLQKYFN